MYTVCNVKTLYAVHECISIIKIYLINFFTSDPQNTLGYRVSNTPNPLKKTDFTLEEWPYVSQNQLLITKGSRIKTKI